MNYIIVVLAVGVAIIVLLRRIINASRSNVEIIEGEPRLIEEEKSGQVRSLLKRHEELKKTFE